MKAFPVLWQSLSREERQRKPDLDSVPWGLVTPHEKQALANHYQSLDTLARRGGLAPCEMCAVIEDRRWRRMGFDEANERLLEHVRSFDGEERTGT